MTHKNIHKLLESFKKIDADSNLRKNERQIANSLILPFFHQVLGWNVNDPEEFRSEEQILGQRADYVACIEGISKFIIESKSLSYQLKGNIEFYKQAIQYADSKGKRYAILTNFKEFVILRSDIKPKNNNWLTLEVSYILIEDLERDLGDLSFFKKEVWANGEKELVKLDSKLNLDKRKSVDERLLSNFIIWRSNCLSWIKKNRKDIFDQYELIYIEEEIQRFLDRIIFISYCEDKGLEDIRLKQYIPQFEQSLKFKSNTVTNGISQTFEIYGSKYNSDLFDRKGLADIFNFDDEIVVNILKDIKQPENELPFDFSIIPSDILGKTYENFIGHVIRGKVKLQEVENVAKRKSEGIYYTPQWVVDYIVSQSILPVIKGKSFKEILTIKIIDPACGSGTFLISAYDFLINYTEAKEKRKLIYSERLKLLLNCIHGVDKDERAVDIAKLNISLKLAQKGEKLPHLSKNILCADSLVFRESANAFSSLGDWPIRFPDVFKKKKGFDIVIGNPPYLSAKDLNKGGNASAIKKEFGDLDDLFSLFIRLSDLILNEAGVLSFIIPNTFFTLTIHKKLRDLFREKYLLKVLDLNPKVFKDAYVFNAIILAIKSKKRQEAISVGYLKDENLNGIKFKQLKYTEIQDIPNGPIFYPLDFYSTHDKNVLNELNKNYNRYQAYLANSKLYQRNKKTLHEDILKSTAKGGGIFPLGVLAEGAQGLVTGNNSKYVGILPNSIGVKEKVWTKFNNLLIESNGIKAFVPYSNEFAEELYKIADKLKIKKGNPTLFGKKFLYKIIDPKNIRDYTSLSQSEKENGINDSEKKYWILYCKGNEDGSVWKVNSEQYLDWRREKVKELKEGKVTNSRFQGYDFYFKSGFGWVDYFSTKIKGFYVEPTVYSKNVVKFHSDLLDDKYLLALINSTLIAYLIKKYITNTRTLQINDGKLIPVIIPEEKVYRDIIDSVDNMLKLKDEEKSLNDHNKIDSVRSKILNIERKLDLQIFDLYGYREQAIQDEISDFIYQNAEEGEAEVLEDEDD